MSERITHRMWLKRHNSQLLTRRVLFESCVTFELLFIALLLFAVSLLYPFQLSLVFLFTHCLVESLDPKDLEKTVQIYPFTTLNDTEW